MLILNSVIILTGHSDTFYFFEDISNPCILLIAQSFWSSGCTKDNGQNPDETFTFLGPEFTIDINIFSNGSCSQMVGTS
ncbi:MAG: hypothetical protein AAF843_19290 [Bacteroidota bacterium]